MSERAAFERGAYAAFSHVLAMLNTLNDQNPDKKVIYRLVMEMTPDDVAPQFPVPSDA